MRDRDRVVAAIAQRGQGQAVVGGQHGGAGRARDVVVGGADGQAGGEAFEHVPAVQLQQPAPGPVVGGERDAGDGVGGQDAVFVQHREQPQVAWREPGGQVGQVRGRVAGGLCAGSGWGDGVAVATNLLDLAAVAVGPSIAPKTPARSQCPRLDR
jgi:hypothetical protein